MGGPVGVPSLRQFALFNFKVEDDIRNWNRLVPRPFDTRDMRWADHLKYFPYSFTVGPTSLPPASVHLSDDTVGQLIELAKSGHIELATLGERWPNIFNATGVLHKARRPMGDPFVNDGKIVATNNGAQLLCGAKYGQLPKPGEGPKKWYWLREPIGKARLLQTDLLPNTESDPADQSYSFKALDSSQCKLNAYPSGFIFPDDSGKPNNSLKVNYAQATAPHIAKPYAVNVVRRKPDGKEDLSGYFTDREDTEDALGRFALIAFAQATPSITKATAVRKLSKTEISKYRKLAGKKRIEDEEPSRAQASPPAIAQAVPVKQVQPNSNITQPTGNTVWPPEKKALMASAAAAYLNNLNVAHQVKPGQILSLVNNNPSYDELCEQLEKMGLKLDRAVFAKSLLVAVPAKQKRETLDRAQSSTHDDTPTRKPKSRPESSNQVSSAVKKDSGQTIDMDINRVRGLRPIEYPIPSSSDEEEQEATAESRAQSTELKEGTDAHADTLVLLQRLQHSEHRMAELLALMTQFTNGQRDFYISTLGVIENAIKDIEGKTGQDQTMKADLSRYIGRLMRRTDGYSTEMAIKVSQLSDALDSSACDVDATLERNSCESYDWCKTKTLRDDFPKESPVIPQAIVIPNAKGASYGVSDVFKRTQGYRDLVNQEDSDGGSDFDTDKLGSNMGSYPTSAINSDQQGPDEMLTGLLKEVKATKSDKTTDLTDYLEQRRLELANTDPVNREQNIDKSTNSNTDSDSESETYQSKKKLNNSDDEASSAKSTSVSVKSRKRKPYQISGLSSTKQPPARPGKRQKRSTNHSINEEGTNSDSSVPPKRVRKPSAKAKSAEDTKKLVKAQGMKSKAKTRSAGGLGSGESGKVK